MQGLVDLKQVCPCRFIWVRLITWHYQNNGIYSSSIFRNEVYHLPSCLFVSDIKLFIQWWTMQIMTRLLLNQILFCTVSAVWSWSSIAGQILTILQIPYFSVTQVPAPTHRNYPEHFGEISKTDLSVTAVISSICSYNDIDDLVWMMGTIYKTNNQAFVVSWLFF